MSHEILWGCSSTHLQLCQSRGRKISNLLCWNRFFATFTILQKKWIDIPLNLEVIWRFDLKSTKFSQQRIWIAMKLKCTWMLYWLWGEEDPIKSGNKLHWRNAKVTEPLSFLCPFFWRSSIHKSNHLTQNHYIVVNFVTMVVNYPTSYVIFFQKWSESIFIYNFLTWSLVILSYGFLFCQISLQTFSSIFFSTLPV